MFRVRYDGDPAILHLDLKYDTTAYSRDCLLVENFQPTGEEKKTGQESVLSFNCGKCVQWAALYPKTQCYARQHKSIHY